MKINPGSLIKATIFGGAILVLVEVFFLHSTTSNLVSWAASALVGLLYVRYHRQKEPVSASQGAVGGGLAGLLAALVAGAVSAGVGLFYISTYGVNSAANLAGTVNHIFNGGLVIVNAVLAAGAGAFMAYRNPKVAFPGMAAERNTVSGQSAGAGAAANSGELESIKVQKRNIPESLQSLFATARPMNDNINDNIHLYLETLLRSHYETEEDLSNELVRQGLSVDVAERLIAFVPMAFERVLLTPQGVQFEPGYAIWDGETQPPVRFLLEDEPIFVAATALAKSLAVDDPLLAAVGNYSAEANLAREILTKRGSLSGIHFSETLLTRVSLPTKTS